MRTVTFRPICAATTLAIALIGSASTAQTGAVPETLTPSVKAQVIDNLLKEMQDNYVLPKNAALAADTLRSHQQAHDYDAVTQGPEFAKLLTTHLQSVCKDAHLRVYYSAEALPARTHNSAPSADEIRQFHTYEKQINGGMEKVERLDGNIGYIDMRGFLEPTAAAQPIRAAMDFIANTDALIIDLRHNGGGDPDTVRLFCSYLFGPEPVHINDIYFRQGNRTTQFWTLRSLPGHRYLNRDVYVLTSKRTASGAEECSYDLQALKRATIVGDSTWGGANPGGRFRLTDHFSAFIPGGMAINPYTHTNWEGTGVHPDIALPAEQALQAVHEMAIKRLLEKATSQGDKDRLSGALKEVQAETVGLEHGPAGL